MMDSVSKQTLKAKEHIVIDGNSSDGTQKLLEEYQKRSSLRLVVSEPDSGPYDAMNKAIKLASGEYIVFLNSDDFFNDSRGLEWCIDSLSKGKFDFAYAPTVRVSNSGSEINGKRSLHQILMCMPVVHQSLIFSRSALLKLKGFDLRFSISADYDLLLRAVAQGMRGCFLNRAFVTFCMGGMSSDQGRLLKDVGRVWHKNYRQFQEFSEAEYVKFSYSKKLPDSLLWKILVDYRTTALFRLSAAFYLLKRRF
ncbi:MAG: glycosyltransferase family 2 protein [Verrucomicrobiota bacterium]